MTEREMIHELGTKVMGWHKWRHDPVESMSAGWFWRQDDYKHGAASGWNPLADWRDTGMVLERMRAKTVGGKMIWYRDDVTIIQEFKGDGVWIDLSCVDCDEMDFRRAICIAALRALGVEV